MRITEVVIRNFRCHKDTRIKLQKYHTLVGENGKRTTVIWVMAEHASTLSS